MKKAISILFLAITGFMMAQSKTLVTINGEKVIYNSVSTWGINGNSGTNPATNFIGTTDDQDLIFRTGGFFSGILNTTNTSWGAGVLGYNTGIHNTGLGRFFFNTSGNYNTAIGALHWSETGSGNTGIGNSLGRNVNGNDNTAIGSGAFDIAGNTDRAFGSNNTGVGAGTGKGLNGGNGNTLIGGEIGWGDANSGSFPLPASLANNIIISDGRGNRRINVNATGQVGIGTDTPSNQLTIVRGTSAAAIKIVDGGEAEGQILISGINGEASWKPPIAPVLEVVIGDTPINDTRLQSGSNYVNSSILLPAGNWIVNVGFLLNGEGAGGSVTPNTTYAGRFTLSSSNTVHNQRTGFSFNAGNSLVFNMVSIASPAPRHVMFVDGVMRVKVTGTNPVRLFVWNVDSNNFGSTLGVLGPNNENYLYATKTN